MFKYQVKHFKDLEFDLFCLSMFILVFGEALISLFVPIYLYNSGYQIYQIVWFSFLMAAFFVLFSYRAAKLVADIGIKHSILLSNFFTVLFYLGLIYINDLLFVLLPFVYGFAMLTFNYAYHTKFYLHSKKASRGKSVANMSILLLIAAAAAPYVGGHLAEINFMYAFGFGAFLILISAIPLFLSKDNKVKLKFDSLNLANYVFSKKFRGNFLSFGGYAVESLIQRTLWPLFLIIIIGSLEKTGLVVSLSFVFSIVIYYFAGKVIDKFNRYKILKWGSILYFFSWIAKIFATSFKKILFINTYANFSQKILYLSFSAHGYDLARKNNFFEFIVAREVIFNLARVIVMPFVALIFWINYYPFVICFILASICSLSYVLIDKK